jgi:hypothetical protein
VVLGLTLETFTRLHVVISLVGIASGLAVLAGFLTGRRFDGWTAVFLATNVLTSLTGYLFPVEHVLPSHVVGAIALLLLTVAIVSRYARAMAGGWRRTYVIAAVAALYLNVFVLVVQSFLKVPSLHVLAPKGQEPPFAIAQGIVLVLFVVLGRRAVQRFQV